MKLKKEKKENNNINSKIIKFAIFLFLIGCFVYFGTIKYENKTSDNVKFNTEFSLVPKDNVYQYVTAAKVINLIKKDGGIILFGFKENEWTNYYASILNEAAQDSNIKKIYYYDFYKDRQSDNSDYEKIINLLDTELITNDEGKKELTAPSLLIVNNNSIIAYDNETSYVTGNTTPSEYWSEYQKNLKKETFKAMLNNYLRSK